MNLLKMVTGFGALGAVTNGPRRLIRTGLFGLDASHRAKENRTHPTHWPAANHLNFSCVRSGCACGVPSVPRANPGLTRDARRMREEDGP
jgi:hypothetical protein